MLYDFVIARPLQVLERVGECGEEVVVPLGLQGCVFYQPQVVLGIREKGVSQVGD